MPDSMRRLVAEFLGTFGLLFVGGLAILSTARTGGGVVVIALGFGLALLAALYAFGEVSGGHFNPAVSLGALLDGRIDVVRFVLYLGAQVAGAVVAGLALLSATSQDEVAATATVPGAGVGAGTAFLLELLLTAVFVAVILRVTGGDTMGPTAFLAIPLTLAVIHLAAVPFSGASVNPARTLGSAVVGNNYTAVWVYLTAPFLGAVLGWALYRLVTAGRLNLPVPARRDATT
jgi:MIP family channel proteins